MITINLESCEKMKDLGRKINESKTHSFESLYRVLQSFEERLSGLEKQLSPQK